ncbi:hypothetical protein ACJX0J_037609, partial [Zea mays]
MRRWEDLITGKQLDENKENDHRVNFDDSEEDLLSAQEADDDFAKKVELGSNDRKIEESLDATIGFSELTTTWIPSFLYIKLLWASCGKRRG